MVVKIISTHYTSKTIYQPFMPMSAKKTRANESFDSGIIYMM